MTCSSGGDVLGVGFAPRRSDLAVYEDAHRSAPHNPGEPSFDRAGHGDTQAEREREPDRDSGWRSPPARRFPQGPCVRSTAPPAGDFAPISGHESVSAGSRSLRRTSRSTVPQPRGEPPGRLSPIAHGNDALARGLFGARHL